MMYYDPIFRAYIIDNQHYAKFYLDYCPACGKKLLVAKRLLELKQYKMSLKLIYLLIWIDGDWPKEFKTDAWWKKRGFVKQLLTTIGLTMLGWCCFDMPYRLQHAIAIILCVQMHWDFYLSHRRCQRHCRANCSWHW